jgi:hypothetical protein
MADAPATTEDDTDGGDADGGDESGGTDDAGLGEAGQKALAAERDARRKAERALKQHEAELAKLREATQSEQEKALAQARAEGKAEALQTANQRLIEASVKAAAAGKLANPALAVRLLDLDEFTVNDDGEVDDTAIAKAIDALVTNEPYLAAGAKPQTSTGGGGARPDTPTVDMTSLIRKAAGRA